MKAYGNGLQLHTFLALALEASDELLLPEGKPLAPVEWETWYVPATAWTILNEILLPVSAIDNHFLVVQTRFPVTMV